MRYLTLIVIILALAVNVTSQAIEDPADMKECIAEIRAWGMSEGAKGSLSMVAGMRCGGSSRVYEKDTATGAYWSNYVNSRCKSPIQDSVQAEQEEMEYKYKLEKEILRLKSLADTDNSGFVSTAEGYGFRSLIEFGYKAAFVAEEENGDLQAIVVGLQVELRGGDSSVLNEKLLQYNALRKEAEKKGISDLPTISIQ